MGVKFFSTRKEKKNEEIKPVYEFRFYNLPEIFHSMSGKSRLLSWTHYRTLLQVHDEDAGKWYEDEALSQGWNVRTLQRNISTQYYYRKLNSNAPELVEKEMLELTSEYEDKKNSEQRLKTKRQCFTYNINKMRKAFLF